jgi:hypothetical protein
LETKDQFLWAVEEGKNADYSVLNPALTGHDFLRFERRERLSPSHKRVNVEKQKSLDRTQEIRNGGFSSMHSSGTQVRFSVLAFLRSSCEVSKVHS